MSFALPSSLLQPPAQPDQWERASAPANEAGRGRLLFAKVVDFASYEGTGCRNEEAVSSVLGLYRREIREIVLFPHHTHKKPFIPNTSSFVHLLLLLPLHLFWYEKHHPLVPTTRKGDREKAERWERC